MTKQILIEKISEKVNGNKKEADLYLSAIIGVITDSLVEGEEVNISGLGKFSTAEVGEKTGTIQLGDRKGETYTTPAHTKPCFKFAKAVKDVLKDK